MNIPSKEECFKLIKQMKMMDHIIDHSIMVSNVAGLLCFHLKKSTPSISVTLTIRAALLHDITKTRSFQTHEMHSDTGGLLLSDMGYPEVGAIIRQHVLLDHYDSDSPVSEEEIVNYADKRVLHDKVVTLPQRLEYIKERYGKNKEFRDRIAFMHKNTLLLESKLFRDLAMSPDDLSQEMVEKRFNSDHSQ